MSPRDLSPAARRELALVHRACEQGWCCQESLAAALGVSRPTLSNWLAGRRSAPSGLLLSLLSHLDDGGRAAVLGWLAESYGVGSVVSLPEARALGQLRQAAAAYLQASPERRAA